MITPGRRLLDVGCDHAYLPIELVGSGVCPLAVATDISQSAVESAAANIKAAQLEDRISVRYADGLAGAKAGECDCLVISGMGGPLMIEIMSGREELLESFREVVLSPQSEVAQVRQWIAEHGMKLVDEKMVCDQHKYYVILKVTSGAEEIYSQDADTRAVQYAYGPHLIQRRDSVLADFLHEETGRLDEAIEAVCQSREERARKRALELRAQKEAACSVMKSWTI